MGPIHDELGLEQGGVNSDRVYKLCNNNQLKTAQRSELGVKVGPAVVSAIGQADDTSLLSDSLSKLAGLVHLAEEYCSAFHVTLVPEKTKLLSYSPASYDNFLSEILNPIKVAGLKIPFSPSAEHVGILRTAEGGNMLHLLGRVSAHRRAVASILFTGMAKGHRGSPVAGLRLERLYGAPVLLSGVAALVLSTAELSILHLHYKKSLRQLLRLPVNTPESFVMLAAGSLPLTALLHLRMLGLLGMIARLGQGSILNKIGRHMLLTAQNRQSWFIQMRSVTQKYALPDPLLILQQEPSKGSWKLQCRRAVLDWWQTQYRGEAAGLSSLANFRHNFSSLTTPHKIITSARTPYEVSRATTALVMLSGRYITDYRTRHWDRGNPNGNCRLCPSPPNMQAPLGDLAHQLLLCNALQPARLRSVQLWAEYMATRPYLFAVVKHYTLGSLEDSLAFLLEPTSCPLVINLAQEQGQYIIDELCYMTRVWVHGNHVLRLNLLRYYGFL